MEHWCEGGLRHKGKVSLCSAHHAWSSALGMRYVGQLPRNFCLALQKCETSTAAAPCVKREQIICSLNI